MDDTIKRGMNIDLDDPRLRSCISKVVHASAEKAHKVLTKSPYKKVLDVYHCKFCGRYHIGHKTTNRKGKRK
jgi:uncharacterized protein with PIN domain